MTPGAGAARAGMLAALVAFVVLATANAAMYRYGVSDQAFYIPVVTRALDPAAFPRDAALIDAQGRLMLADEVLAALVRTTGASLESLFLAGYLLSLVLIFGGLVLVGRRLYANPWTTLALVAAFTMRHHITRTSANTFESYFHPRMLAFGVGVLAVAAFVHRRHWLAVVLVVAAGGRAQHHRRCGSRSSSARRSSCSNRRGGAWPCRWPWPARRWPGGRCWPAHCAAASW